MTEPVIPFLETNVNGPIGDILSKNSCSLDEDTCNFGHEPYSLNRLNGINPQTGKKFTENEKADLIKRFDNKCSLNPNASEDAVIQIHHLIKL